MATIDLTQAEALDILVLETTPGGVITLRRLCTMPQFQQACAELVCVLGGAMLQLTKDTPSKETWLGYGNWESLEKYLGVSCTPELVWSLCATKRLTPELQVQLLYQARFRDWPTGGGSFTGMTNSISAIDDLTDFADGGVLRRILDARHPKYLFLRTRAEVALLAMETAGYRAHSAQRISEIVLLAASSSVFMVVTRSDGILA